MAETLADLYREVGVRAAWHGLENAPPRPAPRQPPRLHSEATRAYNARRNRQLSDDQLPRLMRGEAGANDSNSNRNPAGPWPGQGMAPGPARVAASAAWQLGELTPFPSAYRAGHAGAEGNAPEAALNAANSALFFLPALGRAAPQREPFPNFGSLDDVTRLPVNPTREIGPNGLPVREPEPFRQSFVGGTLDLNEAAAMQPAPTRPAMQAPRTAPDAYHVRGTQEQRPLRAAMDDRDHLGGPPLFADRPYLERLQSAGFDTSTPLYHGTNQPVAGFDVGRGGAATKSESSRLGVWLSDNPETAGIYAENAGRTVVPDVAQHEPAVEAARANVDRLERAARRTGNWDEYERAMAEWEKLELDAIRADDVTGQNIMPVFARIQNPKVMDFGGNGLQGYPGADFADAIRAARDSGHDAVILQNLRDPPQAPPSTHVVVFDPANIAGRHAPLNSTAALPREYSWAWRNGRVRRGPVGGRATANRSGLEDLRAQGFNVDDPLYRGMTQPMEGDSFRPTVTSGYEDQGPGVSVSRRTREAEVYAGAAPGPATEGATIYPVYGRGKYIDDAQYYAAIEDLVANGANYPDAARQVQLRLMRDGYTANASPRGEVRFWPDESGQVTNVRSRFHSTDSPNAGPSSRPPDTKSYRLPRKPPPGGFSNSRSPH